MNVKNVLRVVDIKHFLGRLAHRNHVRTKNVRQAPLALATTVSFVQQIPIQTQQERLHALIATPLNLVYTNPTLAPAHASTVWDMQAMPTLAHQDMNLFTHLHACKLCSTCTLAHPTNCG